MEGKVEYGLKVQELAERVELELDDPTLDLGPLGRLI